MSVRCIVQDREIWVESSNHLSNVREWLEWKKAGQRG